MSISRAGLKQIVACDAGTLSASPTNPTAIGLRNAAMMEISNFKQVEDYKSRPLRNMKNFKIEAESLQPTILMLKNMISFLNLGCDLQVITRPQSSGGSGDVYKFSGNDKPGLDLEYMVSADKRSLKAIWEIAMEYARAQTLIDGADNATPVSFSGITGEGENFSNYRAPYFLAFESPAASAIFSKGDIKERSYSIKTKNRKSIYNASIVDYLTFEFKIVAYDSSVAKQVEIMAKDQAPGVLVKEQNNADGSLYDAFDFAAGVLALNEIHTNQDDDRNLDITLSADVHIYDITWALGATNGGAVSPGDGSEGGTMKIGY